MSQNSLPDIIPVFPLTGVLLLPRAALHLNVFEERYRHMMEDALEGELPIGMIQPLQPRQDNRPPPNVTPENPELYPVGCAGTIERWEKTQDGRYMLLLRGMTRFRILEELPLLRGYRRVRADFSGYASDLTEAGEELDSARLIASLEVFAGQRGMPIDNASLSATPPLELLNGLAARLPFGPAEKQALLEAPDIAAREKLLLSMLEMGGESRDEEEYYRPPPVN